MKEAFEKNNTTHDTAVSEYTDKINEMEAHLEEYRKQQKNESKDLKACYDEKIEELNNKLGESMQTLKIKEDQINSLRIKFDKERE